MTKQLQPTFDFSNRALYNAAYLPVFKNNSRFIHLYGSAGSGKSVFGCQKEIVRSFQSERQGRKTLVIRKYFSTLLQSVYSQLKQIIFDWKLQNYFEILKSPLQITNKITGVVFVFAGLDDVEKIKSIQGVDRILIEEATELASKSELDQLSLRLRGFDNPQITLLYNPVNEQHWLNTEIHEKLPPDHFILKTTYRDNTKLLRIDPKYALQIESLKISNPNYYRVYGLGLWGKNPEGLIYPEFAIVSEMPEIQFYGLDFGFNDPTALVAGAILDEFEAKRTYYASELLYKSKLTPSDLINDLERLGVDKFLPIIADSARPELIEAIQQAGYWINPSLKGAGSVKAGISRLQNFNLKIKAGSTNLIREIQNYSWKNKNGVWLDEPAGGADHLLDALRYAASENQSEGAFL